MKKKKGQNRTKIRFKPETIQSLLKKLQAQFKKAGFESPRLEAELILSEALGISRPALYLERDRQVPARRHKKICIWTKERAKGKPFAYIIGKAWFREIELLVNPSVMIPRPETELLVESALKIIREEPGLKKILDLGTGSGAIILSLAWELKGFGRDFKFFASDISPSALRLAKRNARRLGLEDQIIFQRGDLFQPFSGQKFDLIICNPPYVSETELRSLSPEIKNYEPRIALNGGKDGLELIRKILDQAPEYLYPQGWLLVEIGLGQVEKLKKMICPSLRLKAVIKDYQAIDRIVIYQREMIP